LLRLTLAALVLATLPCVAFAQTAPGKGAGHASRRLIVISIDGLDARLLNDPNLKVKAPNIRALMKDGASATVVGVAPSDTWAAHASLVTGVSPWQNGIAFSAAPNAAESAFLASGFRTETLWEAASHAGLKTATIYWPSTLGASVAFDFPEFWQDRRGDAVPPGEQPNPFAAPSGCAFRTRCVHAQARCAEAVPELLERTAAGHFAACHFAAELTAAREPHYAD